MAVVCFILLVLSFVLLLCAAFGVGVRRVSLGWLGLACWVLTVILGAIPA